MQTKITGRSDGDFDISCCASLAELRLHEAPLRATEVASDFFATWPWFENLASHGIEPEHERLFLLLQPGQGQAPLCLPLLRRARGAAALYGPVVTSLSNYYSSLYGPVGGDSAVSLAALRAVVRWLGRRGAAVLDFQPLDDSAPFITGLESALRAEGYATDRYQCFGNWYLVVGGRSFEAYEPSLPSRLRNTIKRGRKKLDGAGRWHVEIAREPGPALDQAVAAFQAIYLNSWKVPEPFPQFVPGLCRLAAENGWLRLGVLRFEDQPIASQLWIVKDGKALIYKLAYDEQHKRFSAGSILSAEMMKMALDQDKVDEVDYLTGDDGYKVDWMSNRRERVGLVAFKRLSLQGLLSLARHAAGRRLKTWREARASAQPEQPRTEPVEGT